MNSNNSNIFTLLNASLDDSEEEIRRKYYRAIYKNHPTHGGSPEYFMELVESYKKYLAGEESINCYRVVKMEESRGLLCRCGGEFHWAEGDSMIRVDCDCGSCFLIVEGAIEAII